MSCADAIPAAITAAAKIIKIFFIVLFKNYLLIIVLIVFVALPGTIMQK
jgi:hypothetical protein